MRDSDRQAIAARGAGNGRGDLSTIDVGRVVRRNGDVDATRGLPRRNNDHCAIGQGDRQIGRRGLANGGGVDDYATRLGDRRGGAQGKAGGDRCLGYRIRGVVDVHPANVFDRQFGRETQWVGREADGRGHRAGRFLEHDEAVSATDGATTRCCWAGCRRFQFGRRVDTGSNCLLQLFNGRRRLRSGLAQVGAAAGRIGAPLAVAAQVEQTAIGELQGYCAARAGEDFLTRQQAIAFDEYTPDAFWRYCDDLANNAFDDGNDAHWTLRVTRLGTSNAQAALVSHFRQNYSIMFRRF
ncbi:hypothetical protein D3C81_456210 [compost metagenome]